MTGVAVVWRLALSCLLSVVATAAVAADRPATDEQVERLLQASRAEAGLAATLPQMEALQRQQFEQITQGKELTPEQKAEVERIQLRTTEVVRQSLAWEQMKPVYVQVYKQTFSADDVKAMTRFYESRAGQSMLDKTPVLMQSLSGAIQLKMIPVLQALEAELKTVSTEVIPAPPVTEQKPRRKRKK